MDKVFTAILGIVVLAVLVGGIVTLQLQLDSSKDENASLRQDLNTRDTEITSLVALGKTLSLAFEQNDRALAKVEGDLKTTNELGDAHVYVATKALSALSAFIPEGDTLVVRHPGFAVGDATFTNRGYNGGLEIEIFRPELSGMKPNTPRGTVSWIWGIFAGTQVETIPPLLR